MKIRPSSLPALKECPRFAPGETSAHAEAGTDRHAALSAALAGNEALLELLPDDDAEGVRWALEYIRCHAPMADHPLICEQKASAILDDFTEISGTPDIVCGRVVFDFKWRHRDYAPQLAAYGLMRLQQLGGEGEVKIHTLFGATKRAVVYNLDAEGALALITPIVEAAQNPESKANPCDYCGWCGNRLQCPALNERAQAVAAGREDWALEQYHASEIKNPAEMAKALALAGHLGDWIEAVKHHAKVMVIKQGLQIPGWKLKERAGKKSCIDLQGAFTATAIPLESFLGCCDIRLGRGKNAPGLEETFATNKGMPKSAAKKQLANTLAPYMRQSPPSQYLAPDKETAEEPTETESK